MTKLEENEVVSIAGKKGERRWWSEKKREEDDRKNKGKEHCGYGDTHLIKKQGGIEKKNDYSSRKRNIL